MPKKELSARERAMKEAMKADKATAEKPAEKPAVDRAKIYKSFLPEQE